jgi:hypothetical protein
MGAFGGVVAIVFGVFWTIMAFSMTRDIPFPFIGTIFPLFGIVFIVFGIINVSYQVYNATGKNRFSEFDITAPGVEPDPLNEYLGENDDRPDDNDPGTLSARLTEVETLRKEGLISEEEYLEQRERILSEI